MDIKHVAQLANLPVTSAEAKTFQKQLEKVLDYVSQLRKVDTSQVGPTSQVTGKVNSTRTDKTSSCLKLDVDYFKVPAIFGNE